MRIVRVGLLAAAMFGCAATAGAADLDYDVLRGADYEPVEVPVIDWSGFYLGGHGGYSTASLGQRNVFQSTLADYFRNRDIETEFGVSNLITLPGRHVSGVSYGAFAGYNMQFDEIVFGVEADYTRFGQASVASNRFGRIMTTAAGLEETVILDGRSKTEIEDYGSVRARAGYAIGNLLPFVTAGLAIGRIRVEDAVSVQNYGYDAKAYAANQASTTGSRSYVYSHGYTSFNQSYPGNYSSPSGEVQTVPAPATTLKSTRSKMLGGVALGAGLEYAITPNLLLRGEYQYVLFQDFNGHSAELNTIRAGAAVKF